MRKRVCASLVLLAAVACGGKSSSPTAPTPTPTPTPTATVTGVTVTGSGCNAGVCAVTTETIQLTATAQMSDSTTQNVTNQAQWTSAAPAIATVSTTGLVTPKGLGDSDVLATYQGKTSGVTVRVGPRIVSLTGTVTAVGGGGLSGATVRIRDSVNAGRSVITDSSGSYRLDNLTQADANVGASAPAYEESVKGVFINGTNTLNFTLRTIAPWSRSGQGDTVFDMPTYITRIRIGGTYTGYAQNFVVYIAGRLVVNELMGSGFGQTRFEGTYLTSGGVVEIVSSSGVYWSFTEVR